MLPLLRATPAVHIEAACPATNVFLCTAAPAVWMFFLVAGPVLGLAIGTCAGAITASHPPPEPPPREPRPDRSWSGGVFMKY
jgi:hypothetical protein